MTPQESLDGIIAGLRCGICPERKMRENPCPVCTGKYAAIERVRLLFEVSEEVAQGLVEWEEEDMVCRGGGRLQHALRGEP